MHKHFAASFLRCPYSWLEDVFRKRTRRFNCRIGLNLNFFKSMKNKQCQVLSIIYYQLTTVGLNHGNQLLG